MNDNRSSVWSDGEQWALGKSLPPSFTHMWVALWYLRLKLRREGSLKRNGWNWDSTRVLYFFRSYISIVLWNCIPLVKIHCTPQLFKYCIPCQVVSSIVFHVRPLRNESATLTHSFTPSSFGRMQLTLFIQLQSIEVGLQGFTQYYKYRWYLVRKCREWLEFSAGILHLVTDFIMQIVQAFFFSLCTSVRPSSL